MAREPKPWEQFLPQQQQTPPPSTNAAPYRPQYTQDPRLVQQPTPDPRQFKQPLQQIAAEVLPAFQRQQPLQHTIVPPMKMGWFQRSAWRWRQGAIAYFSPTDQLFPFLGMLSVLLGYNAYEDSNDYWLPGIGQFDGGFSLAGMAAFLLKVLSGIAARRPRIR